MDMAEADPKGLVRESYLIEGITPGECRSIFLDWALSLPSGQSVESALRAVIAHYGAAVDHPMTQVLHEGLGVAAPPRRRGGRATRVPPGH
jgi:hypothetical protein